MKFRVSQIEFSKALSVCDKSLPAKANLPILANVLLVASKNTLEVVSTNLETATKVNITCKAEQEGGITLPGKILSELVSQLPEGEITLEKLGEEMLVSASSDTARFATMNPEDFPAIPKIEKGRQIKIDGHEFIRCIEKVEFCAAQDESRPILSGVLVEIDKKKLSLVSTDGYRLSFVSTTLNGVAEPLKLVIPAKTLGEVGKIIAEYLEGGKDQDVTLVIADNLNQVNFKIGDIEFTSRLIEGEFPNWQKIIPSVFTTKIRLSKAVFNKQIRIASIFARDAGNIVRLKFEGKTLTTMANTSQVGSNEAKVETTEMTGKGGEIAFNYRYLQDAFSVIDSEDLIFEMIESLSPGRITGFDDKDDFFHIIMPVRLQG